MDNLTATGLRLNIKKKSPKIFMYNVKDFGFLRAMLFYSALAIFIYSPSFLFIYFSH